MLSGNGCGSHRPSISLTVPLSIDTDMVDGSINGMDNGGVGVLEEEEQTIVIQIEQY